jgi:hypothetical protein
LLYPGSLMAIGIICYPDAGMAFILIHHIN